MFGVVWFGMCVCLCIEPSIHRTSPFYHTINIKRFEVDFAYMLIFNQYSNEFCHVLTFSFGRINDSKASDSFVFFCYLLLISTGTNLCSRLNKLNWKHKLKLWLEWLPLSVALPFVVCVVRFVLKPKKDKG